LAPVPISQAAPLILHNIKKRFKKGEIYTNVGTILISVNPYQRLPLYTKEIVKKCVIPFLPGLQFSPKCLFFAHEFDAFAGFLPKVYANMRNHISPTRINDGIACY
jgi:hypothetical protein